ncbi:hypothetical protein AKJ09_10650 [Labilithrix luteola]|uniref:PAC domain-containing protein n=1 Tax=Labilithrix luteola TaxID=1391654 RepID=A0A0K1QE92_9BACT|nr:GAF domain-containing protein [Labilithrix luteola]AKV03987.1 hypothetical protein AKJ09_10650 [Labilithrix luteola]
MGDRLASFYEQAESVGGLDAKIRLALLTRIPSTRALVEPDSPQNVSRFETALTEIRREAEKRKTASTTTATRALPGNEELLWGVLSSLHDAMVAVFDQDARCMLAWDSRSLEARYGNGKSGFVRETIARHIADQRGRDIRRTFEVGRATESEMAVALGAHEVWISVALSPIHDDKGRVTSVAAFISDVTERRRAALALEKNAERLRTHNRVFVELMSQRTALFSDPMAAFRRLTEAAAQTLDVARASIWFYDDAKSGITCIDLFEKELDKHSDGVVLAAKDFPAYFAGLLEERTIAADDAHKHPMTCEFSEVYLKPLGINSMLDVPIWVDGQMVGVVCHEHVGAARAWTPDEENFAYLMGSIAALVRAHQRQSSASS